MYCRYRKIFFSAPAMVVLLIVNYYCTIQFKEENHMKTKLLSCLLIAMLLLSLQVHSKNLARHQTSDIAFNEALISLECDGPDGVMIQ